MDKFFDINTANQLLPKRFEESNKSTYGKVLNIAGSKFYQGAAYLSSLSALLTGAGYVSLACPDCILSNIASQTPDITFIPLKSFNEESIAGDNAKLLLNKIEEYDAVSLGCGLTTNPSAIEFIDNFLKGYLFDTPVVIDADALNAISSAGIEKLPQNTIITPHPKELSRLLNIDVNEINSNRIKYARLASDKFSCITVLKGNKTIITNGKYSYTNTSGNSGLAKAGTGDVLTGIITALSAQNLSLFDAAALGCYIHGLAADIAREDLTQYSILASSLLDYISKAIAKITV